MGKLIKAVQNSRSTAPSNKASKPSNKAIAAGGYVMTKGGKKVKLSE